MEKRSYTQLTPEQRYQIWALRKAGFNQSEIATELKVHKSTISRELKRNRGQRGYRPQQAQRLAQERQRKRAARPRILAATWVWVEEKLAQQWSPEQISGRLRHEQAEETAGPETAGPETAGVLGSVSHERIYQYIYADKKVGGTLHQHLRCQKKRRKRYGSGRSRRGQIAGRVCISQRPKIVEQRARPGDWEADTIVGKGHQQAIVSLCERLSRYTLLAKVEQASAPAVSTAIIEQMKPLAALVETITADNGKEFAHHQQVAVALEAEFYFAHPYSSWERGLNENTNGLVRQYCPKGSRFETLSQEEVEAIAHRLNHRPRKVLDYKTPFEVFSALQQKQIVALST
jgi:transposase, IS30 family